MSQRLCELKTNKERLGSELDRHQGCLDRLIDLYADTQFDRVTLDRKTQKLKRELKQLAKELERTEHEKEEIERGKA